MTALPGAKQAGGEIWPPPNLIVTAGSAFHPKALPRKGPAPISLFLSGTIGTRDGTWSPALETLEVEGDKHVAIDVKGDPTCARKDLRFADTAEVRRACGDSLVGSGEVKLGIKFPETLIPAKSKLLLLYGGFRGGTTTLFLHAHITIPTPRAIVAPVKIRKIDRARYGLRATVSIPPFLEDDWLVESFYLNFKKGILTATCTDARLQATIAPVFVDGTEPAGTLFSPCTPKG
ncbi:MAG TPA: hypothetical protein VMS60_14775 [Solirubrobacterales bacterium]|nr:hypothetical protein [Solirubrobacterales bacterium]